MTRTTHVRAHQRGHTYHNASLDRARIIHTGWGHADTIKIGSKYFTEYRTYPSKEAAQTAKKTDFNFPGGKKAIIKKGTDEGTPYWAILYPSSKPTSKEQARKEYIHAKGEQAKEFAKEEWGTFKNFLARKKQERETQKALKEETGHKLETY